MVEFYIYIVFDLRSFQGMECPVLGKRTVKRVGARNAVSEKIGLHDSLTHTRGL